MMGKAGSISLACLATSHPSSLPSRWMGGHERAVRGDAALEQGHGLFASSGNSRFKTAFSERIFNDALNGIVIFNHEDNGLIFQRQLPRLPSQKHHAEAGILFPEKRAKVNLRNLRPEVLQQENTQVLKMFLCVRRCWPILTLCGLI